MRVRGSSLTLTLRSVAAGSSLRAGVARFVGKRESWVGCASTHPGTPFHAATVVRVDSDRVTVK